jgi:hypothetical protein
MRLGTSIRNLKKPFNGMNLRASYRFIYAANCGESELGILVRRSGRKDELNHSSMGKVYIESGSINTYTYRRGYVWC